MTDDAPNRTQTGLISIRSHEEISLIRECGRVVADALDLAGELARPGATTEELNARIEELISSRGADPEFKGFKGYPASICASVNEEVVHGIPGPRALNAGDIVGVDVGVRKNGYVADGARTFAIAAVPEETERLMRVTEAALTAGLAQIRDGVHLGDVSHAIQTIVENAGFSVVRTLAGHGVGTQLHEPPEIPNYGRPGFGPVLKKGMVLAVEPMVNAGGPDVETMPDGWTVVTADRRPSAHFERTVAVRSDGFEDLTKA